MIGELNMRHLLYMLVLLLLAACKSAEVGSSCERTGDSFLTRDGCENTCLAWPVKCGDGSRVAAPNVCSGKQECSLRTPCPDHQVCAVSGGNNYCVPLSLCPSGISTGHASSAEMLKKPSKTPSKIPN